MFHARVLVGLTLLAMTYGAARADGLYLKKGSYAAIAYSPSTKHYGYAYNHRSRCAAEQAALAKCRGDDARVVTWVKYGFCALVRDGDGAWGAAASYGVGSSNLNAIDRAKNAYRRHSSDRPRVVVVLSSDGQYVYSH